MSVLGRPRDGLCIIAVREYRNITCNKSVGECSMRSPDEKEDAGLDGLSIDTLRVLGCMRILIQTST